MLRIMANGHHVLRMLGPRQKTPYEEVWHLWSVIVPRRSITGRLLWGIVFVGGITVDGFTRSIPNVIDAAHISAG